MTSGAAPEAGKTGLCRMTEVCRSGRPVPGGCAHGRRRCQGGAERHAGEGEPPRPLTPLQKLDLAMRQDEKTVRELAVGRRLGLYKVRGPIGSGSFSSVRLAVHALTADKVAIKVLDKSRLDAHTRRLLSQEIASMERLHHPNVIRLYEVLETPSRLHLVMEYAEGGELYTRISAEGKLSDTESKIVFSQILSAVKHMHEKSIVHRDLKAENVFYTRAGCVKVGDFGFSAACGRGQTLSTSCGSAPYAAPELFGERRYAGGPVDVWALGVLLFFMATGAMPFRADTVPRLKRLVLRGAYSVPRGVAPPCRRLIQAALRPLPAERPTAQQMSGCDWLQGVASPRPLRPFRLDPAFLAELDQEELDQDELEARDALEELGITAEHVRNNRDGQQRGGLAGVYRILLHRAHRRRGLEAPPTVLLPVADPRGDWIRAYTHLRHTSKLCTIA